MANGLLFILGAKVFTRKNKKKTTITSLKKPLIKGMEEKNKSIVKPVIKANRVIARYIWRTEQRLSQLLKIVAKPFIAVFTKRIDLSLVILYKKGFQLIPELLNAFCKDIADSLYSINILFAKSHCSIH
ncbi:MAG: hypothetical protein IEMM0008_1351 [bacterium]|nr:MAG: hypothetical protein IEMM0008_1351 [bacterium]